MTIKRGYFVYSYDPVCGIAVVATSAKEAKKIAWVSGELNTDWVDSWINTHVHWRRNAAVGDISIGEVQYPRVVLLCGIYEYLDEYPCDGCGRDELVHACDGRALCGCCIAAASENKNKEVVQNG